MNPQNQQKIENTLADKRLDLWLSEFKLISNLQNQQKIELGQLSIR